MKTFCSCMGWENVGKKATFKRHFYVNNGEMVEKSKKDTCHIKYFKITSNDTYFVRLLLTQSH